MDDAYTDDFATYVEWCRGRKDREREAKRQATLEKQRQYMRKRRMEEAKQRWKINENRDD